MNGEQCVQFGEMCLCLDTWHYGFGLYETANSQIARGFAINGKRLRYKSPPLLFCYLEDTIYGVNSGGIDENKCQRTTKSSF